MTRLRKAVGLRTVIATSTGLALATVSLTAGVQIGLGLPGASGWIAVLAAGLISVLSSWCFAELVGMFPTAAGIKLFIEKAFGEKTALISATLYVGITILIVGSESYILASVLHYAFPAIPQALWVFGFLGLIALINIRGIRFSGLAQDITTYGMVVLIVGVTAWGLFQPGAPAVPEPFTLGAPLSLVQAVALGVFLYLGFEWVTPLAEEVTDFRLIPKGMLWSLLLLGLVYGSLHIGMMTWVPKADLAASPIPHVLFGQAALGKAGLVLMAGISALASITSYNAGLMTASRFLYAMARDGAAPKALSRVHAVWATPWAAILALFAICSAMAGFVLLTGSYKLFIFLGAAIECLIFVLMALSVIRLRKSMPGMVRDFRVPGGTTVAWIVVVLYSALFVAVFIPDPARPGDAAAQMGAAVAFVVAGLGIAAYVQWVVPKLRARLVPKDGRRRRRPGAS